MNSFGQSLLSTPAPTKTIPKAAAAAAALPVAATRWCLDIMCSQIFIRRTRTRRYTSSSRYRYSNPGRYRTTEDEWEIHDNFQPFVATCRASRFRPMWVGGYFYMHLKRISFSSPTPPGQGFWMERVFDGVGLFDCVGSVGWLAGWQDWWWVGEEKWPNWYVHCSHFVTGQLDKLIKYPPHAQRHGPCHGWWCCRAGRGGGGGREMKIQRDRIRVCTAYQLLLAVWTIQ